MGLLKNSDRRISNRDYPLQVSRHVRSFQLNQCDLNKKVNGAPVTSQRPRRLKNYLSWISRVHHFKIPPKHISVCQ